MVERLLGGNGAHRQREVATDGACDIAVGTPSSSTACSDVPGGRLLAARYRNTLAASNRCTAGQRLDPSPR